MARVMLTPGLQPKTEALKRFDDSITELNRFYWTFRCALMHLLKHAEHVHAIPELLPSEYGGKLNVTSTQFKNDSPETERVARHSLLVLSVTSFEDYLKEILTTFLIKNWNPEKTYKVAFKPEDIPNDSSAMDWLKAKATQATIDEYIGRPYKKRLSAIAKLLNDHGANSPSISSDQAVLDLAAQACEARNCIVHASSVIDDRAVQSLSSLIPGMKIGAPLNISEDLLWKLLGALRDSARSLDVEVRALV